MSDRQINLDNASTTFPKPREVAERMYDYLTMEAFNINRGTYAPSVEVAEIVFETREMLCGLFGYDDPSHVIFTAGVTASLNMILKGLLKSGDHVIVSPLEHNAVMRPLVQLEKQGVTFSRARCQEDGTLILESLEELLTPSTRAVVMTHASNVCGTLMPIQKIGEFCYKHKLLFILDAAQTGGVIEIDMKKSNIAALAFSGHKNLLGPQGIGGFILNDNVDELIAPIVAGGTGSISDREEMPEFLPDKYEPGTLNIPGIYGLNAALRRLDDMTIEAVVSHELELTERMLRSMKILEDKGLVRIVGRKDIKSRVGIVSIDCLERDNAEIAARLEEYDVLTRVGMHCAPSAHRTLNTYPSGTLRFSFGIWNTLEDVDTAMVALREIML